MIDLQNQYFENFPRKAFSSGNIMIELTIDKEVFRLFILCVGLLLGKTILMSMVIAKARFFNHVSNLIDYLALFSVKNKRKYIQYRYIYISTD